MVGENKLIKSNNIIICQKQVAMLYSHGVRGKNFPKRKEQPPKHSTNLQQNYENDNTEAQTEIGDLATIKSWDLFALS